MTKKLILITLLLALAYCGNLKFQTNLQTQEKNDLGTSFSRDEKKLPKGFLQAVDYTEDHWSEYIEKEREKYESFTIDHFYCGLEDGYDISHLKKTFYFKALKGSSGQYTLEFEFEKEDGSDTYTKNLYFIIKQVDDITFEFDLCFSEDQFDAVSTGHLKEYQEAHKRPEDKEESSNNKENSGEDDDSEEDESSSSSESEIKKSEKSESSSSSSETSGEEETPDERTARLQRERDEKDEELEEPESALGKKFNLEKDDHPAHFDSAVQFAEENYEFYFEKKDSDCSLPKTFDYANDTAPNGYYGKNEFDEDTVTFGLVFERDNEDQDLVIWFTVKIDEDEEDFKILTCWAAK